MPRLRERIEIGGARGLRYDTVPGELLDSLPHFLDGLPAANAETLKIGSVWRVGDACVKRFEPRRELKDWLRASPALRSAELHFALAPVRTPRPIVALERRGGRGGSLLVAEFVRGSFLQRSWDSSAAARARLPLFFADLNARGYFHGDLHARNLLWNGDAWVLIDLEGVRPRAHGWLLRRRIEDQWSRLVCALEPRDGLRESFESYLDAMQLAWPRDRTWNRIERRARAIAPKWAPRAP